MTFESYDQYLENTPDRELPDATAVRPDTQLIVEEAKILRGHPFLEAPDLVASLRELVNRPDFKYLLEH